MLLSLRLLSSLIGFASMIYLFVIFKDKFFNNNKIFNYLLFFTFWFYPFLHSRTSAESLSLSLFIISFCSIFVTIIVSIFPALKAAKLDPIKALKYE